MVERHWAEDEVVARGRELNRVQVGDEETQPVGEPGAFSVGLGGGDGVGREVAGVKLPAEVEFQGAALERAAAAAQA